MLKSQQGFTLLEMLIVIAIFGIFANLAFIQINNALANNDLTNATNQMAINIRAMQHLSLQKGRSDTNTIVNMTITPSTYTINSFGTSLPTVTLPNNITANGNVTLVYDPYEVVNNTNSMITLTNSRNQEQRTIVISKETGRIRIDSSHNPSYLTEEK